MARKRQPKRHSSKLQPAPKTLSFNITEAGTNYIDLSQCASIVNRRFYRQGLNWAVSHFTFISANAGQVSIEKIPDTWMASNAWHKSYAAWKQQQDETMKDAGAISTIAKYRDFKIHADPEHVTAAFATNMLPMTHTAVYLPGEDWDPSQIVIPNDGGVAGATVEYLLHMVGPDMAVGAGQSKALIENYANSRSVPFSPDPEHLLPANTFFNEMHDVGEQLDDIVVNATNQNDELPYDQDAYPGGAVNAASLELLDVTHFTGTTLSAKNKVQGTNFPCGLIKLVSNIVGAVTVLVHLVPGTSRGYLAQDMQDM